MSPIDGRLRGILEVIERDNACADTYAVRQLLATGHITERSGQLYLTRLGRRAVAAHPTETEAALLAARNIDEPTSSSVSTDSPFGI